MKTIFDKKNREQLINRIDQITVDKKAKWGKMNVFQMLKHNTYWNGWVLGKDDHTYKQAFMGKIFGKTALKRMIKDEKPFDRNIPTPDQFKAKELNGDFEFEKSKWISLINEYENYCNPKFIHGFFGRMNKEQIGILVYKHTDHHLRQFGLQIIIQGLLPTLYRRSVRWSEDQTNGSDASISKAVKHYEKATKLTKPKSEKQTLTKESKRMKINEVNSPQAFGFQRKRISQHIHRKNHSSYETGQYSKEIKGFIEDRNNRPLAMFKGYSPAQLQRLLLLLLG